LIECGNLTVFKDEFDPERDSLVILADRTHIDLTWLNFYLNLCGKPAMQDLYNLVPQKSHGRLVRVLDGNSFAQGTAYKTPTDVTIFEHNTTKFYNAEESALQGLGVTERSLMPHNHRAVTDATRTALHNRMICKSIEQHRIKTLQTFLFILHI